MTAECLLHCCSCFPVSAEDFSVFQLYTRINIKILPHAASLFVQHKPGYSLYDHTSGFGLACMGLPGEYREAAGAKRNRQMQTQTDVNLMSSHASLTHTHARTHDKAQVERKKNGEASANTTALCALEREKPHRKLFTQLECYMTQNDRTSKRHEESSRECSTDSHVG